MNICNNLLGYVSNPSSESESDYFDPRSLINKLLLFDNFILRSPNFNEIPYFVKVFGFDGTLSLLESGALKISCEARLPAQIAQSGFLAPGGKNLPLGNYCVAYATIADRRKWISDGLQNIDTRGLSKKQIKKLKLAVVNSLDHHSLEECREELLEQTKSDLGNNRGIELATAIVLRKEIGLTIEPHDFLIKLHRVDEEVFQVETNLDKLFTLDNLGVHKIVEQAIFGIAKLNLRIAEMEIHNALSGFQGDEAPLFKEKLFFLLRSLDPAKFETTFERVIKLKNYPEIVSNSSQKINVEKLIEIRKSSEIIIFRDWLTKIESVSDSEIIEQLNDIRSKLGIAVQSPTGRAARLLISTLAGFLPDIGTLVGIGLGAMDTYCLEKVLPTSPVVSFIDKLYPSIFESKKRS